MTELNPILAQLTDYTVNVPETFEKPVTYVLAANGAKYVRKAPMGLFVLDALKIPGLEDLAGGMHLDIPKIPFAEICKIYAFFKEVSKKDHTEASALIFYDRDAQEFITYVPEQYNTAGNSDFTADTRVPELRLEKVPVMELHSHGTGGAFWSGTDDANEKLAQTYMVMGNMDKAQPSFEVSFGCAGLRVPIQLWDIIEPPEFLIATGGKTYKLQAETAIAKFLELPFPAEWMDQLKHRTYAYGSGYGVGGGANWMGSGYEWDKKKQETQQTQTSKEINAAVPQTSKIPLKDRVHEAMKGAGL